MWSKVNKNSRNADGLSPFLSLASKFYMAIGGIAPRITWEIFFLVRNTLDCYGKFFFSCKTPLIVTGNFFFSCGRPLIVMGNFFFSCERPSITQKKGAFLSQKHSPKTNQKNEVLFQCHAPQQNSTMSCAVKILRNMLSG